MYVVFPQQLRNNTKHKKAEYWFTHSSFSLGFYGNTAEMADNSNK